MIPLLIILSIVLGIIVMSFLFYKPLLSFLESISGKQRLVHWDPFPARLDRESKYKITKYFDYYRKLPKQQQLVFDNRVVKFMNQKTFQGRQGLEVTPEMELFISAAAVILTFGQSNYMLYEFEQIIIYPSEFNSAITGKKSKGETNSKGVIVFSWPDFLYGIDREHDSINLGFHEFAHALFLERMVLNRSETDIFVKHYKEWIAESTIPTNMARMKRDKIFREYAFSNDQEFFAASVEKFFEEPGLFRNQLPLLYNILSAMLNQNPLNREKLL